MMYDALPESVERALLWLVRLALLTVLFLICRADLRARRIPNSLVAAGLLIALAWQAFAPSGTGMFERYAPGALGLRASMLGAAFAFAAFFVMYLMRVMGAGDVKMMTMLGAAFGARVLPELILVIFLSGGLMVLVRVIDGQRRRAVFSNLRLILFGYMAKAAGGPAPEFNPKTDSADRMPFALAIAIGAVVYATILATDLKLGWSLR
jgi:prepilin peptidase CpaA